MTLRSDETGVRVMMNKAAAIAFKNWRETKANAKDELVWRIGFAFDTENPAEPVELVVLELPWAEMEHTTETDLANLFFTVCYQPKVINAN